MAMTDKDIRAAALGALSAGNIDINAHWARTLTSDAVLNIAMSAIERDRFMRASTPHLHWEQPTPSPAEQYASAESITNAGIFGLQPGDWVASPQHNGYLVRELSRQSIKTLEAKVRERVKELFETIDARVSVIKRSGELNCIDGLTDIDAWVNANPAASSAEIAAHAELVAMAEPAPVRVMMRAAAGHVAPAWADEPVLMADRGPIDSDVGGIGHERFLWARGADARWRPVIPGHSQRPQYAIGDETMSELNPATVTITEETTNA